MKFKKHSFVAIIFFILTSSSIAPLNFEKIESVSIFNEHDPKQILTIYEKAVLGTIVPASIIQAIAIHESGENDYAIGPDKLDWGRMQLRSVYNEERARKWFAFDPFNPYDSTRIAALIMEENYLKLGSWALAICAYNQGAVGVIKNGMNLRYLNAITRILRGLV